MYITRIIESIKHFENIRMNQSTEANTLRKVLKKIVEFSTKRGGVWIGRFSTKKNIGSKHWKWPKMYFKTNLFFSIFGGTGVISP